LQLPQNTKSFLVSALFKIQYESISGDGILPNLGIQEFKLEKQFPTKEVKLRKAIQLQYSNGSLSVPSILLILFLLVSFFT
jgi:hypothetical protein